MGEGGEGGEIVALNFLLHFAHEPPNAHSHINSPLPPAAETVADSIILELCGTFAEVYTADVLLQGKTNLDDLVLSIKWCLGFCGCAKNSSLDSVSPQESVSAQEPVPKKLLKTRTTFAVGAMLSSDDSFDHKEKKKHMRIVFCTTAMIMNTITEASGLIVGSLFWICSNANPSASGGKGLDVSQAILNFFVMLFGELVLSDSVVAYISHKFESRYVISLAHEWEDFRETQRTAKMGLIVIISMISSVAIMQIPNRLCLTSHMSNEEDWTLSQCPKAVWNETLFLRDATSN